MGAAALRLADRLGRAVIDLIPWQEGSILDICSTSADDQFAAAAAGLVVSRQNGKGGVLELRVVAGVTLPQFGERRILWTAHTWKTARDAHQRVANIFLSHPDLKARLKHGDERGISYGNDSRSITLRDGSQILFFTRSATAGRGLWADLLICDEALDLTDTELSVLRYTMRTSAMRTGRRGQVIYVSTPPDEEKHPNGVVFSRLRERALAGAPGVCWLEWSVPSLEELQAAAVEEGRRLLGDPRLTTEEYWPQGNPSLGYLFDIGTLRSDFVESGEREFLVEGLAAPDYWPSPEAAAAAEPAIDIEVWKSRRDPLSRPLDPVSVGLEISLARVATLTATGWRKDGRKHGELIWSGPAVEAVRVLMSVVRDVDPATLVVDSRGPTGSLLPDIRAAGLDPRVLTSIERSQADDGLVRDIEDDQLRLPGEPMPELDAAAATATWRSTGDVRYFDRRAGGPPPAPLVSLSLARFGLLEVAARQVQTPPAQGLPLSDLPAERETDALEHIDVATASF